MPTISFPTFPPVGLTSFDLTRFDLTGIKLPDALSQLDADRLRALVRDAAYVVIGFGVLTFQQAQVRRRELVASLGDNPVLKQAGIGQEQIEQLVASIERRVGGWDGHFDALEGHLDSLVDSTRARLPERAGTLLVQAHRIAKAARTQMRGLVANAS